MEQQGNTITGATHRTSIRQSHARSMAAILRYPRASFILFCWCAAAITGWAVPSFVIKNDFTPPSPDNNPSSAAAKDDAPQRQPKIQLEKGTPAFKTMLPAGKSVEQLGGWTKVSPPNRDPTYAYVDTIGAVKIQVSQQELPKAFRVNTAEEMAHLAKNFSADTKLTVPGAIAYLGTSAKGPQSVIVAKNNLLILIKSSAIIPEDEWEAYIKSLS